MKSTASGPKRAQVAIIMVGDVDWLQELIANCQAGQLHDGPGQCIFVFALRRLTAFAQISASLGLLLSRVEAVIVWPVS